MTGFTHAPPTYPGASPTGDPDVSRRGLKARPVAWAMMAIAGISFCFWLGTRNEPQLMIAIAIAFALTLDAVSAHLALADVRLSIQSPNEAIAGRDVTYFVQATGVRRPVLISRPGTWPVWRTAAVVVDSERAGALTLTAPPRGIIRFLVFDVVAHGPLGLFESCRRLRVWLPSPMYIGPPPVDHEIEWPRQKAVRFGENEVAKVGDDLFRGTRPYVRGDAQRLVHWPATAHHGQLMVRETDGLGMVAMRIVVHLPAPGPAAEIAAARAAWLADEGARRGWLVQLLTMEAVGLPPLPLPLQSATGPLPFTPLPLPVFETANHRIRTRADVTRQLAAAGYGMPTLDRWQGITRVVSPWGDEWQ